MDNFSGKLRVLLRWVRLGLRLLYRLARLLFRFCIPYLTLGGIKGDGRGIVRKRLVYGSYHVILLGLLLEFVLEYTLVSPVLIVITFILYSLVAYRYLLYIIKSRSYLIGVFQDVYIDSSLVDRLLECRSFGSGLAGSLVDLGGWLFCTRLGLSRFVLKSCSVELLVYCLDLGDLLLTLCISSGVLGGYLLCHSLVAFLGSLGYFLGVFWLAFAVVLVIVLVAVKYYLVNLLEVVEDSK